MKKHIVTILSKMNVESEFSGENGDKAFLQALFLRVFGPEMHKIKLAPTKLKFIKGVCVCAVNLFYIMLKTTITNNLFIVFPKDLFAVRTKGETVRFEKFDEILKKKLQVLRAAC